MNIASIGLIGYGEVGKIFTSGLIGKAGVHSVSAWDLKFATPTLQEVQMSERLHASSRGVQAQDSLQALSIASDLIIGAVTASTALSVAQEVAKFIRPGGFYLDLNSASPGTKQKCAALIDAAGGIYVEAGVMTSVPPYGIRVPMLLGGARAADLAWQLSQWGMDAKPVSDRLGVASAIKMSRSVMIKGLEALVIESYTTARAYGVEDHVLPTLKETFPSIDWSLQGAYFFSRVVQHGKRRSEEMHEAANMVKESGFEPLMASATALKQQWISQQAQKGVFNGLAADATWQDYADRLLAQCGNVNPKD